MFCFDLQQAEYESHAPKTSSAHAAKEEGGDQVLARLRHVCVCAAFAGI